MLELLDDLYRYNDWANAKVLELCHGLSDEQLDQPREIGFGTLRATLFHIWSAEQIWIERWQEQPWRPFQKDPEGVSLEWIRDKLKDISDRRRDYIAEHRDQLWKKRVKFQDSAQTDFHLGLGDLIVHVFNHGTHHRAQALAYLKKFDRTTPMGIDYIFYRTAVGSTPQSPEATEMLANFEMHVGSVDGEPVQWDAQLFQRWCVYSDWANHKILDFATGLSGEALRRDFQMGPQGSILGTLQHLFDVERWWFDTMITGENQFGQPSNLTTVDAFGSNWLELAQRRDEFMAAQTDEDGQAVVAINFGGPDLHYTRSEAIAQCLNHGVHHRAQLINMLRHSDAPIENIDMLYALDHI